mmetsp:Transcript_1464/g.1971  ORF Transcript_1464/g.1971 Transcript_1464/m.1971 type:complete len:419 (+) Transcript_1464:146-1402(+)|eukprot:CAMPEP_0178902942 /NCGR_PEP_ID=MMETSP0786-20121207/4886_1 /TAXON_ID=186022 /ORGANISM="Thalassionema frauenfeldii, Strain CCMP 1798" /LENGTH=418 /DNA_ID=CAMNT_0020574267 /DNA_START=23 /DNA_END=1279 /DNA_ORIENTATION=+
MSSSSWFGWQAQPDESSWKKIFRSNVSKDSTTSWLPGWNNEHQQKEPSLVSMFRAHAKVGPDAGTRKPSFLCKESSKKSNTSPSSWFSTDDDRKSNNNSVRQLAKQSSNNSLFLFGKNVEEKKSTSGSKSIAASWLSKDNTDNNKQTSSKSIHSTLPKHMNDEEEGPMSWFGNSRKPTLGQKDDEINNNTSNEHTSEESTSSNSKTKKKHIIVLLAFGLLLILGIGIALGILIDDDDDSASEVILSSPTFLPAGCFEKNEMVVNFVNTTDPIQCSQRCSAFPFYSISTKGCGCVDKCPVEEKTNVMICNCNSLPPPTTIISTEKKEKNPPSNDNESKEALYALISLVLAPILLCLQEPCRHLFLHWYRKRRRSAADTEEQDFSSLSYTSSDGLSSSSVPINEEDDDDSKFNSDKKGQK